MPSEARVWSNAGGGPEAVRVEAVASRLGSRRGGFHWHFSDQPGPLEEIADSWEQAGADGIIARVESNPDRPRARLLQSTWCVSSSGLAVELAVRDRTRSDATSMRGCAGSASDG